MAAALRSGAARVEDIPALVVVSFGGQLSVVCGNRRLAALRNYQESVHPRVVLAKCIVHRFRRAPPELVAKFIDAASTTSDGADVRIRRGRRHG